MRPTELDELLSSPPHLDGAEFTARVMERLPPRRAGAGRLRRVALVASGCAGLAAGLLLPGARAAIAASLELLAPLVALPSHPASAGAALLATGAASVAVPGAAVLASVLVAAAALARSER